jgi:hypothetical protein
LVTIVVVIFYPALVCPPVFYASSWSGMFV